MKLFKVTYRGMQTSHVGRPSGIAFVVACDAGAAYEELRRRLDQRDLGVDAQRDLGVDAQRELHTVELVADISEASVLPVLLFGRTAQPSVQP